MKTTNFQSKIQELINSESREQDSDTPDFILAEYLMSCLEAFEMASNQREAYYGRHDRDDAATRGTPVWEDPEIDPNAAILQLQAQLSK